MNRSDFIDTLNKDIVQSHFENIENKIFSDRLEVPFILFDDGEVVTDDRGSYWTQIPPAFNEWEDSFLSFEKEGKKMDRVILTMQQAYHYREKISLAKKGNF